MPRSDDAIDRAKGGKPRVQWSLDGEPIRELPWRLRGKDSCTRKMPGAFSPPCDRPLICKWALDPDGKETLAFDFVLTLFGSSDATLL